MGDARVEVTRSFGDINAHISRKIAESRRMVERDAHYKGGGAQHLRKKDATLCNQALASVGAAVTHGAISPTEGLSQIEAIHKAEGKLWSNEGDDGHVTDDEAESVRQSLNDTITKNSKEEKVPPNDGDTMTVEVPEKEAINLLSHELAEVNARTAKINAYDLNILGDEGNQRLSGASEKLGASIQSGEMSVEDSTKNITALEAMRDDLNALHISSLSSEEKAESKHAICDELADFTNNIPEPTPKRQASSEASSTSLQEKNRLNVTPKDDLSDDPYAKREAQQSPGESAFKPRAASMRAIEANADPLAGLRDDKDDKDDTDDKDDKKNAQGFMNIMIEVMEDIQAYVKTGDNTASYLTSYLTSLAAPTPANMEMSALPDTPAAASAVVSEMKEGGYDQVAKTASQVAEAAATIAADLAASAASVSPSNIGQN